MKEDDWVGLKQNIEISWFDPNGIDVDDIVYPDPEKIITLLGSDPTPEGFTKVPLPLPKNSVDILTEEVEAQWKVHDFNNNILPDLRDLRYENGKLHLKTWVTDYKSISMRREILTYLNNLVKMSHLLKSDRWHDEISAPEILELVDVLMRNITPVTVGGATLTKGREEFVFGKKARDPKVQHGGLYINLPAGHIRYEVPGRSTPKDAIYAETKRELGLNPEEFPRPSVFTVVNGLTHAYDKMIIAELDTGLPPSKIEEIFRTKAGDKYETDSLLFVKNDRAEMRNTLRTYWNRMIDVGLGVYLQFGRKEHGENWYQELLAILHSEFGAIVQDKF